MATRFYYDPVAVPTISPTFDAAVWDQTTAAVRRCLSPIAMASGATEITFAEAETSATNNFDVLLVQAISPPLAAQTISGAISGQIRASETDALANMVGHINVRAFNGAGATDRGTLLDAADPTEFVLTTLTNRKFPVSTSPTSTVISEGDVLVVEVGYRAVNTATTSWSGTVSLGSGAAADLAVDESTTAANNPWIEFADNLLFMPDTSSYNWKRNKFMDLSEQGTGTANAALTVTLPASIGYRHAIKSISIGRACAGTGIAGSLRMFVSTLNLSDMGWVIGDSIPVGGTKRDVNLQFITNPLLADRPSTPTVFAFPAPGANVLWSVRIGYTLVP